MIADNLLLAPPTTSITVTRISGKADKQGMFQVFGFRTGDTKLRLVTFWLYRKEAQEVANDFVNCGPTEEFVAEIDAKAWVFVHAQAGAA